jgi:hypothetical protein
VPQSAEDFHLRGGWAAQASHCRETKRPHGETRVAHFALDGLDDCVPALRLAHPLHRQHPHHCVHPFFPMPHHPQWCHAPTVAKDDTGADIVGLRGDNSTARRIGLSGRLGSCGGQPAMNFS